MSQTFNVLKRAWRDAGGAAIADYLFEEDTMSSLLTPEKADLAP